MSAGAIQFNVGVCEPSADRVASCSHEEGIVQQHYDADGCGYRVWRCIECGWEEFDELS